MVELQSCLQHFLQLPLLMYVDFRLFGSLYFCWCFKIVVVNSLIKYPKKDKGFKKTLFVQVLTLEPYKSCPKFNLRQF